MTNKQAMEQAAEEAKGITGRLVGPEPEDEREHFYTCKKCGQAVDMRDLGAVFHHEVPGHKPIPPS